MAVDSITESYFCKENLLVDEDYYLNVWSECHFLGTETFSQVKSRLTGHVTDLIDYMDFINRLPMIEYFIHYNFTDDAGICAVYFQMLMQSLLKLNSEVLVYNDMEILLCGFLHQSIDVCEQCYENSKHLESSKQHCTGCPYLNYIIPDLNTDVADILKSPCIDESNTAQATFLENVLVQKMYETALSAGSTGAYGIRSTVHALPSMESCSKEENYMLAEFTSSNDGHIFTKWLSRLQAIKVTVSKCNLFFTAFIYVFILTNTEYHLIFFI
jgi:hypothetical protein